jgi:hypothetical protein
MLIILVDITLMLFRSRRVSAENTLYQSSLDPLNEDAISFSESLGSKGIVNTPSFRSLEKLTPLARSDLRMKHQSEVAERRKISETMQLENLSKALEIKAGREERIKIALDIKERKRFWMKLICITSVSNFLTTDLERQKAALKEIQDVAMASAVILKFFLSFRSMTLKRRRVIVAQTIEKMMPWFIKSVRSYANSLCG